MRPSEVFDNFVKIAQEQGLTDTSSDKAKKKLEETKRHDYLDADAINKLYGIKPDSPKDMQYNHNIVEIAHPNPIVVSPAYDNLNGLVENVNERQNILLRIVNKTPRGLLTNHKYAQNELLMALVRVGNDVDNRNLNELRVLSDTCLEQMSHKITKTAALPLVGIAAGAIASALAALYAQQNLNFLNEGFEANHRKLIAELDDLITSNSNFGVGHTYKPTFIAQVQTLKQKLESFFALYQKSESIIASLEQPRTAQELVNFAQQADAAKANEAFLALKSAFDNMLPYLSAVQRNFASDAFRERQIQDTGFLSSLVDKVNKVSPGNGLVANDLQDVVRAMAPYLQSVHDVMKVLKSGESVKETALRELEQAASQSASMFGPAKTETALGPDQDFDEIDKDLKDLGLVT